jgi:hypothetical protein
MHTSQSRVNFMLLLEKMALENLDTLQTFQRHSM